MGAAAATATIMATSVILMAFPRNCMMTNGAIAASPSQAPRE